MKEKNQNMTKVWKSDNVRGGGWTDEGKKQSLMCLGLVRSDSDCGREQKVKPKVAIIYLITDPLDAWRTCWNTHFSHSFCILSSFLSCVSRPSFANINYANSEIGALI